MELDCVQWALDKQGDSIELWQQRKNSTVCVASVL